MRDIVPGTDSSFVIMVVDDEPELADVLREVLEVEGYQVLVSRDAARAPLEIQQAQPDLVILDVRMRGARDFQVLHAVKGDPATAAIPVLLCTAMDPGSEDLRAEVVQHGCGLVLKPFALEDLVEQVRRLIEPRTTP